MSEDLKTAKASIIRVGSGRGFVVELPFASFGGTMRVILTAAQCLPELPPAPAFDFHQRTFSKLVGPLGMDPSIRVECNFVDPIADLAFLGMPTDVAELSDEWKAYSDLVDSAPALTIGTASKGPAWRLSLSGEWIEGRVWVGRGSEGGNLWINADWRAEFESGMAGSPIIQNGQAIGLVSLGDHLDPSLAHRLPTWAFAVPVSRR